MNSKVKLRKVIAKLEEMYGSESWVDKKRNPLEVLIKTILSQSTSDWNRDLTREALKKRI